MQASAGVVTLSPTDLSAFLGCRHRTALDLAVALGLLARPQWVDPFAELLRQRGEAHERQFVESLEAQGLAITNLRDAPDAAARTIEAMRSGGPVVVQARLEHGHWGGYADVLRRVEVPSDLGAWSYEVWDTKLARETRGGTILQLSAYSDLLARAQGRQPERFFVVTPDPVNRVHEYRVDDYAAYYRLICQQLAAAIALGPDALQALHYPEPVEQCEVCRWWARCDGRRRHDDHLSFIAGITRLHRRELEGHEITTLAAAGAMRVPIPFQPARGGRAVYERLREQARLQVEQRATGRPVYELLDLQTERGLLRLPAPSPGDVFLDLEGDLFAREGGREYLFGLGQRAAHGSFVYRAWWATTDVEERAAFEEVIDAILAVWDSDPAMHVYHYGHYEPTALKRLMGRYVTREAAIDRLLRGLRFVDLFAVVRQALRAGVENYSIKQLEPFYAFTRDVDLGSASFNKQLLELSLEADAAATIPTEVRQAVEGYNRDDCRSTLALRDWLEARRADIEAAETPMPRPAAADDTPSQDVSALEEQVIDLRARLLYAVPPEQAARSADQHARWLLAWLLDWHRRESRAGWWEYYRLRELPEEDLLDERKAIAGLNFVAEVGRVKKSGVYRYSYPPQDVEITPGTDLKDQSGATVGSLEAINRDAGEVDIKQGPTKADLRPTALFDFKSFSPDVMQRSLLRLGEQVLDIGFDAAPASDLLLGRAPRLRSGPFAVRAGESGSEFAVRIATDLDRTVLPIQGPPGSGKTRTGARMICALVSAGKRVGVTAVSHKVIANLMEAVMRQARELAVDIRPLHRTDSPEDAAPDVAVATNQRALDKLAAGEANVVGGTAWLWSPPQSAAVVDVLFVDEAGQMSLANVLAVSQAAASVVLLGDPQQLEQPQKASHPEGTDISALDQVLGGAKTMPSERGIFLERTWRLAPAICGFTSELFYENRLQPIAGLERQHLSGTAGFDGSGLWYVPVDHDGNQNWAQEEVDAVARIVAALTGAGSSWVNRADTAIPLRGTDILVVAPYNAHVNRLTERLRGTGVRIGTVDKFQGQEEAVVIYSMATSRPDDAPRGMEFLYSLNRLNVATSRARCMAILVASPRLFEPECRTPRQMQLANALCRFRELARALDSTHPQALTSG